MAITGKKIKIGLIGAGRMGSRWAKIISDSSIAELSLVVDPNKEIGQEIALQYGVKYFSAFGEINVPVDAFFIITPHAYLCPNAQLALQQNKPVFIEKPAARNVSEINKIIKLARTKNQHIIVGFNYRYFDNIKKAKEAVDANKIGKILFMRLRHGHSGRKDYRKEWRMNKKISGGGVLMDQGVHLIDLIQWFIGGKVKQLSAVAQKTFWKSNVEENAFVVFKNNQEQIASMSVGITEWKPIFSMEIIGEKGYILAEGLGRKYGGKELLTIGIKDQQGHITEKITECNPEPENALKTLLVEFVSSIKSSKISGPTVNDARQVLQIVEKIYKTLNIK